MTTSWFVRNVKSSENIVIAVSKMLSERISHSTGTFYHPKLPSCHWEFNDICLLNLWNTLTHWRSCKPWHFKMFLFTYLLFSLLQVNISKPVNFNPTSEIGWKPVTSCWSLYFNLVIIKVFFDSQFNDKLLNKIVIQELSRKYFFGRYAKMINNT